MQEDKIGLALLIFLFSICRHSD